MAGPAYRTPPRPELVNYDEAQVPPYNLPELLRLDDGAPVTTPALWRERRRAELLETFAREVYGQVPGCVEVAIHEVSRDAGSLAGLATRLELDLELRMRPRGKSSIVLRVLVWLPNSAKRSPIFLGLNLCGNQTVHPDPTIRLARDWLPHAPELGIDAHAATEASRGLHARRWPVELVVLRGYALATVYAGDIDPDHPHGFADGVRARIRPSSADDPSHWGALAAWAWGLSRTLDALEQVDGIDSSRVAVVGHSRFGKAALWAGARDERIALTISSCAGRGGGALSRRRFGETVRDLNDRFPHWFCPRFRRYSERESELPVDQHELIALHAPRPVYLSGAAQDLWGDPRGEFLACKAASPAYELLGVRGVDSTLDDAPIGPSLGDRIGYHRRPGGHDMLAADWWRYLDFSDRFLKPANERSKAGTPPPKSP